MSNPPTPKASAWQALNVQNPTSNANAILRLHATKAMLSERRRGDAPFWLNKLDSSCLIPRARAWLGLAGGICLYGAKNVTILHLPCPPNLLHLVCPHGQPRYYLLLTGIHRFLAPLFTSIPSLFEPQPLSYRHDSTQTRNSARVTK